MSRRHRLSPATVAAVRAAATKAPGSDGIIAPGGFLLDTGERNSKLSASTMYVTQDNLIANITIIAAAIGVWLDLGGSAKWTSLPNPKGGRDAKYAAELVQDGMIDARMPTRWRGVVKRQLMKRFRGAAMHAKGWRRDESGRIVLAELAHRPMWSIERWIKPLETDPWTAVVQRTRMGTPFEIQRADLFYSHEGAIGDDPRGVGLLRHLVEAGDASRRLRQIQHIAFDADANGIPVGRAPLAELAEEAVKVGACDPDDGAAISNYVRARVAPIANIIENRIITPNRSLLLDSSVYNSTEADGAQRPSSTFKYAVDTIRQQIGSLPELGKAIASLDAEMACVLSAEFLLMGRAGTSGAYAAASDKSSLFARRVDTGLDDIGDDGERDIVPDILARNGITDERCMPTLQHEPVAKTAAERAATALKELHAAALKPGDPADNVIRARLDLPPAPEVEEGDVEAWRAARSGGRVPEINSEPDVPAADKPVPDEAPSEEKAA